MPLVDMKDMPGRAYRNRNAVGGFDLVSLDFLEAIVAATEATRAPEILSPTESHFEYYDFELAMAATVTAVRRTTVPVAIHLDHGASPESAVRAINLGCNGIMVDASQQAFAANIAACRLSRVMPTPTPRPRCSVRPRWCRWSAARWRSACASRYRCSSLTGRGVVPSASRPAAPRELIH